MKEKFSDAQHTAWVALFDFLAIFVKYWRKGQTQNDGIYEESKSERYEEWNTKTVKKSDREWTAGKQEWRVKI